VTARRSLRIAALGLAVAFASAGCARAPEPPPPVPVRTAPVAVASVATSTELSGSVVAAQSARVGAVVAGRIDAMLVRVGDRVTAGQPLATIDDASYRAQLAEASAGAAGASEAGAAAAAGVAQTQARLDLARATQQRMARLYAQGAISRQEFDQAQADFRSASAVTEQARAQRAAAADAAAQAGAAVTAASIAVADGTIRAPFDGVVSERFADAGTAVGPGTPVVAIQSEGALEVDVAVPQANAADLHAGSRLDVRSGDLARTLTGTVRGLAPADPALRSTLARIALPAAAGLRPGMFVHVVLRGVPVRGSAVPLDALVTRGGQTGVFVIADGKAIFAPVRTGAADLRLVQVSGLRPGDREVATTNLERLSDGAAVAIER
jgi:RND family efflux transporter MFP subunit